jgi:hypothetical protein
VRAYVDTSVVLRVAFAEPDQLEAWSRITRPLSSELLRIECLRTLDRARLRQTLDEAEVASIRADLLEIIDAFDLVELDEQVKARATEPFPTMLRTLGAMHLSSAVLARAAEDDELVFATHDRELAIAATAMGFKVLA